jgi:hypothetical protein
MTLTRLYIDFGIDNIKYNDVSVSAGFGKGRSRKSAQVRCPKLPDSVRHRFSQESLPASHVRVRHRPHLGHSPRLSLAFDILLCGGQNRKFTITVRSVLSTSEKIDWPSRVGY